MLYGRGRADIGDVYSMKAKTLLVPKSRRPRALALRLNARRSVITSQSGRSPVSSHMGSTAAEGVMTATKG